MLGTNVWTQNLLLELSVHGFSGKEEAGFSTYEWGSERKGRPGLRPADPPLHGGPLS